MAPAGERRIRAMAALAAGVVLLLPAGAQATSVQAFLAKVDALKAKGAMAAFSPDLKPLKQEINDAAQAWRAQISAARPAVCAPPKLKMNSDEIIKMLQAVPPPEQARTEVSTAFVRDMNVRYRCR